jgi:hypothetical protein
MDPFTTLQNNMQRDVITQDFKRVLQLILDGQNDRARERVEALNNRADGIAQPVRDIRNFTFTVPEHNLEDIFRQPNYTRPKPMVHYRVENGTKYYNANLACLADGIECWKQLYSLKKHQGSPLQHCTSCQATRCRFLTPFKFIIL